MNFSLARFASIASRAALAALAASLAACATAGGPASTDPAGTVPGTIGQGPTVTGPNWPVRNRQHVDLWLHGFAMIQDDTTLVPYFRRGYKADMTALRRRANATTQLDANTTALRNRFSTNLQLVNAQFVAQYFESMDELLSAMELFQRSEGNPRAASSREAAEIIALLAGYFPLPADREWARTFTQSVRDENTRFYRGYWDQQQRERAPVLNRVTDQWQNTYRPRFERFLNNTGQSGGEILLSLPLNGEGRTLTAGKQQNSVAVTFPLRESDASEAIYVIAHEIVGQITQTAVRDNVTPNDARMGLADRYIAVGAVRAGAMLLQHVAPELLDGYSRYYLNSANRTIGANVSVSLASAFLLPDKIRDAISRQIDVVLGGI